MTALCVKEGSSVSADTALVRISGKELTKQVRKYSEEGKVALRNIRRDAMDEFKKKKKASEITEDDLKELEKELQDLTDKRCKDIDELTVKKEQELMAV